MHDIVISYSRVRRPKCTVAWNTSKEHGGGGGGGGHVLSIHKITFRAHPRPPLADARNQQTPWIGEKISYVNWRRVKCKKEAQSLGAKVHLFPKHAQIKDFKERAVSRRIDK